MHNVVYVPSAFSMSETEPEVSFLLVYICKFVICMHTHAHLCVCVCVCAVFSLHVICNVNFSLKNPRDSFDGTVKIF